MVERPAMVKREREGRGLQLERGELETGEREEGLTPTKMKIMVFVFLVFDAKNLWSFTSFSLHFSGCFFLLLSLFFSLFSSLSPPFFPPLVQRSWLPFIGETGLLWWLVGRRRGGWRACNDGCSGGWSASMQEKVAKAAGLLQLWGAKLHFGPLIYDCFNCTLN